MSQDRKMVKIFSFIAFAMGVALLVMGVMDLVGHAGPWETSQVIEVAGDFTLCVLLVISSVFGIKGANRPSAIDPLLASTLLGALCAVGYGVAAVIFRGDKFALEMVQAVVVFGFFVIWRVFAERVVKARDRI